MARKHGWQLPAHKYQVIAITVFCLLVIAYYAFLVPFIGGSIWKYSFIGVYSPVAIAVFILYVRCTAINPADPGIVCNHGSHVGSESGLNVGESTAAQRQCEGDKAMISRNGSGSEKKASFEESEQKGENVSSTIFCALFVYEDCRKRDFETEHLSGEEALYCTLCKAEVRKLSKHCRSCDKCVDGFDHHCRWLNNCVGFKNYYTFIFLMAVSLFWLAIEAGVGIAVFVRCFADKNTMKIEIVDNLGNGFSLAPFSAIVGISTVVSLLACIPLGELFFFHIILIRKGISTYEYVVAMRAMSEAPGGNSVEEELPNLPYSPSNSATTGFSGGSSHGLSYKGAWCTPPRIFVDYQEEVVPQLDPGMLPSTVDPDAERATKGPKKPVRISAWKVAKLDSDKAMKAGAKARASSSVLRPVGSRHLDSDRSPSENVSVRSSVSTDREMKAAVYGGGRDEIDSLSNFSSPAHETVALSPLPEAKSNFKQNFPSTSYKNKESLYPQSSIIRDIKRSSVVWDQEAGRYVSVPISAAEARHKSIVQSSRLKQVGITPQDIGSSGGMKNPDLEGAAMHGGDSILYGGAFLNGEGKGRLGLNLPRDGRYKRDAASNQLPVFLPGGSSDFTSSTRDKN